MIEQKKDFLSPKQILALGRFYASTWFPPQLLSTSNSPVKRSTQMSFKEKDSSYQKELEALFYLGTKFGWWVEVLVTIGFLVHLRNLFVAIQTSKSPRIPTLYCVLSIKPMEPCRRGPRDKVGCEMEVDALSCWVPKFLVACFYVTNISLIICYPK